MSTCKECLYHFSNESPYRTRCLITVYDNNKSLANIIDQLKEDKHLGFNATLEGYSIPRVNENKTASTCASFEPKGKNG